MSHPLVASSALVIPLKKNGVCVEPELYDTHMQDCDSLGGGFEDGAGTAALQ